MPRNVDACGALVKCQILTVDDDDDVAAAAAAAIAAAAVTSAAGGRGDKHWPWRCLLR
jgi:hypothetical protein